MATPFSCLGFQLLVQTLQTEASNSIVHERFEEVYYPRKLVRVPGTRDLLPIGNFAFGLQALPVYPGSGI